MMRRGFVKLWRSSCDNELYFKEPFTKWQAWQDLILLANWEPTIYTKRGIEIKVARGQLAWSEKGLSVRWKWSRQKVRGFISSLKLKEQIEHQSNNVTTLITIVNYEIYQELDTKKDTRKTPKRHQKDTSKEVKEVEEVILSTELDNKFEVFWKTFGDSRGKTEARKAFYKLNPSEKVFEQIIAGAKLYSSNRQRLLAKGLSAKMGQGWITGRRWEDDCSTAQESSSDRLDRFAY